MISAKDAKKLYDDMNSDRNDVAIHVKDAGDFYVIVPKIKSSLGVTIVSKEGQLTRMNRPDDATLKNIFSAKTIF